MRATTLPEMNCLPLPRFDLDDWPTFERAFAPLPAWKLRQAWLHTAVPLTQGGVFRAGTWADALVVLAELSDQDIFNPVTAFNEVAFTHGDAFEMFLRPEGQDAYFEFHVTPFNQKLQLRFDSALTFRSLGRLYGKDALQRCKVSKPLFDSRVQVNAAAGHWRVVSMIPFASVIESNDPSGRARWRFSASRYDYTRGHEKPVLSSTSAHTICDFHRQNDWGILHLSPLVHAAPTGVAGVSHKPA